MSVLNKRFQVAAVSTGNQLPKREAERIERCCGESPSLLRLVDWEQPPEKESIPNSVSGE